MVIGRFQLSGETIALALLGLLLVGAGVYVCHWAYALRPTGAGMAQIQAPAALPPLFGPAPGATVNPMNSDDAPLASLDPSPVVQEVDPAPATLPPVARAPRTSPPMIASAPLPAPRPADLGYGQDARPAARRSAPGQDDYAPSSAAFGAMMTEISRRYDRFTAVYDLTTHTVYLPNGARLEAHSGLGDRLDDPRYVNEQDRGATPPHVYDLTLREQPFHGVQALRLNPVGGPNEIFGRAGLLAHTYMLGPNGDSNGCVSFKDYDAFLQAYQSGVVKRLAVVARLN